ncbi:hypothetical protein ITP53_29590 [Nonomuraea sp. K274]|uniref:Lipoprotein n=1 Tax=Nonomuraea cypriaca TaxID=1187855 RepID=A0A931AGG8_9ACTN|nr:hypothetical protein [Nonomuraea cypriaca]MBF8189809.1 hypothetical protein [Nonomuraea cypriaca]
MTRSITAMVAVAALGLGVAGCGGSSDDPPGGPRSGASSAVDEGTAKLVKYAECMRSNGVPGFPDPVDGQLDVKIGEGSGVDMNAPQFKAAQEACRSLAPAGVQSGSADDQQVKQMLRFASCMRENGVKNFPDPKDGNLLIDGIDPNTPQFKTAMQTCRKHMPDGGPAGGQ